MNGWIVWNATAEVKVFHVYTMFMVALLFLYARSHTLIVKVYVCGFISCYYKMSGYLSSLFVKSEWAITSSISF